MHAFRVFLYFIFCFFSTAGWADSNYSVLSRGINAWGLFTKPTVVGKGYAQQPFGGYQPKFELADFRRVREQGFDFVRLPVDPAPFLSRPEDQWGPLLAQLGVAVDFGLKEGLSIVVDLHSRVSDPDYNVDAVVDAFGGGANRGVAEKYVRLAAVVAAMLETKNPYSTLLEPFNEPGLECNILDGSASVKAFNEVARVVRQDTKIIRLVFDPNCQSSWRSLLGMSASSIKDVNVVFSFHFYDPFLFTHQGSHWSRKNGFLKDLKGYPYPYDRDKADVAIESISLNAPSSVAMGLTVFEKVRFKSAGGALSGNSIDSIFKKISGWARLNGVKPGSVLLGEFGTLKPSDSSGPLEKDRALWLEDVRRSAEKYGFGWAVWEYVDVMGVTVSPNDRTVIPSVQKALGLQGGL